MNGEQITQAIDKARKGERVAYHVGCLMADRMYHLDVDSRARAAWAAMQDGKVRLVQERVSGVACRYLAVRRPYVVVTPAPAPAVTP